MTNDEMLELAAELINNPEDIWRFIVSFLTILEQKDAPDDVRWQVLARAYHEITETADAWQETMRLLRNDILGDQP